MALELLYQANEQIKKLEEEKNELADAIETMNNKCVKIRRHLEKRIAELEAALQRIDNWAKAYPIKAFPEPDLKKAAKVLKDAGLTIDAISASNMRHVLDGVKDITKQALKPRT